MKRLSLLRSEYEEKQEELATYLGISPGTVSNWETGKYEPTIDMIVKIADRYGVSTDYLLGHYNSRVFSEADDIRVLREYLSIKTHREFSAEDVKAVDDIITRILKFRG